MPDWRDSPRVAEVAQLVLSGAATEDEVANQYGLRKASVRRYVHAFKLRLRDEEVGVVQMAEREETNHHEPEVPRLTLDFFNWMAKELTACREELARTNSMLKQYQDGIVSNELAKIYHEYTRR